MLESVTVKEIGVDQTALVERFLEIMGDSASGFRYFAKRPLSVIANHLVTLLILDSTGDPVGYGHLDPENGTVWLGACVAEGHRGKGLGKAIVGRLLSEAIMRGVRTVSLSVDEDNTKAMSLYYKFGFMLVEKRGGICFLRWERPHTVTR